MSPKEIPTFCRSVALPLIQHHLGLGGSALVGFPLSSCVLFDFKGLGQSRLLPYPHGILVRKAPLSICSKITMGAQGRVPVINLWWPRGSLKGGNPSLGPSRPPHPRESQRETIPTTVYCVEKILVAERMSSCEKAHRDLPRSLVSRSGRDQHLWTGPGASSHLFFSPSLGLPPPLYSRGTPGNEAEL